MSHIENSDAMLNDFEARVLGSLMEKQMTTPDYYPLTLNALMAACNQKSSRVPVMNLSSSQIGGVVNGLRGRGLVTARINGRADKFEQHLSRKLSLTSKERAIICVLLLRGALTINEIRINTGRMVTFDDGDELVTLVQGLIERDEPLMVKLPRASGQREDRYMHLLCGEPDVELLAKGISGATGGSKSADAERIEKLEQEVMELREQLGRLWKLAGLNQD